jgi:hypothetical protein
VRGEKTNRTPLSGNLSKCSVPSIIAISPSTRLPRGRRESESDVARESGRCHFKHVVKVSEKPNDECQPQLPLSAIFDVNFGSRSDNPSRRLQQDSRTAGIYLRLSNLRYRTTVIIHLTVTAYFTASWATDAAVSTVSRFV